MYDMVDSEATGVSGAWIFYSEGFQFPDWFLPALFSPVLISASVLLQKSTGLSIVLTPYRTAVNN
jgi:hypothetical protein